MNEEKVLGLKKIAKENLIEFGSLANVFLLENRNGEIEPIIPEIDGDTGKDLTAKVIGEMLKSGQYKSFVQICEAWTLCIKDAGDLDNLDYSKITRPSENPDSQEAIMLTYKEDDGAGFMIQIPFTRDGDKFVFMEEIIVKNNEGGETLGGRFWEMWS